MIRNLAKGVVSLLSSITGAEYSERSHQVEFIGKYNDNGKAKDVICTLQLKHYIPRDEYGEAGYFYTREKTRRVRDENRKWVDITEEVTYYELSPADKKFIYVSYVHHHLNQRQISKLSDIPQPYVYRYIKHMKLKPKYEKTPKSLRNINFLEEVRKDMGLGDLVNLSTDSEKESKIEIPDDFNTKLEEPFHVDPYPSRSEWKVRRESLGLKNGENWRNTPYDENPGPKIQGDGSTVKRKKTAKLKRREGKRIRNIKKYNLHQNNRYKMSNENPDGDINLRKYPEVDPYEKQKRREEIRKERNENKDSDK